MAPKVTACSCATLYHSPNLICQFYAQLLFSYLNLPTLTLSPPAVKTQWLSVPGVPASCEKFPHSSQLNFWSTESISNQFSVFLETLNAICVCLQYKHPRSIKRVIRSDKPVTLLHLLWSHKCNIGAEPRSRIIATSAVKGLMRNHYFPTLICQP
jgi:hypothetical protein